MEWNGKVHIVRSVYELNKYLQSIMQFEFKTLSLVSFKVFSWVALSIFAALKKIKSLPKSMRKECSHFEYIVIFHISIVPKVVLKNIWAVAIFNFGQVADAKY